MVARLTTIALVRVPYVCAAVPARAALGIISMLIGLTNIVSINTRLPPGGGAQTASGQGESLPWLMSFMLGSFVWNSVAMTILVFSSFGAEVFVWLNRQQDKIKRRRTWQQALLSRPQDLVQLLQEWDVDGSGAVSRREFQRGISALGLPAQISECNDEFDAIDSDNDGVIYLWEVKAHLATRGLANGALEPTSATADAHATRTAEGMAEDMAEGAAEGMAEYGMAEYGMADDDPFGEDALWGFGAGEAMPPLAPEPKEASSTKLPSPAAAFNKADSGVKSKAAAWLTASEAAAHCEAGAASVAAASPPAAPPGRQRVHIVEEGAARAGRWKRKQQVRRRTSALRSQFQREAREELGEGWLWGVGTFWCAPCVARLRHLDWPARFLFPVGYSLYVLVKLHQVNFFGRVGVGG